MPSSTVTLTSSFFTAGNAARIRYSPPVSLMSTDGAQSNFPSVSAAKRGKRPKKLGKRLNISSTALKGSQRTRLMAFSSQIHQDSRLVRHGRWLNSEECVSDFHFTHRPGVSTL